MDEAASKIKMEIESKPAAIDSMERKIAGLQVELHSVSRDQDKAARDAAAQIKENIANLQEELTAISARWKKKMPLMTSMTSENVWTSWDLRAKSPAYG